MVENEGNIYQGLTQSQLAIWTGQKLNPEAPLYNMAHSFEIVGPLDVEIFQNAFQEVINRADALRTVFHEKENIPYQTVLKEITSPLKIVDFSLSDDLKLQKWLKERSRQMFDLSARLFDSVLLRVDSTKHIWFLNVHHLVTDATTSTLLFKLISDLYGHLVGNTLQNIQETPLFGTYVEYNKQETTSEIAKRAQDYWDTKIALLETPAELYGNIKMSVGSRSDRVSVKLGKQRSDKIRALARTSEIRSWTQDLTLFNLFSTALFVFLYRVSRQKKLCIGAPSHNRTTKRFKLTPGLFISVFPLLLEFKEDDTFLTALERVKLETNSYLKFSQHGSPNPLVSKSFNVVLNYINTSFSDFNGLPMRSEWIHPGHCDPSHQLRCHVYDMNASGDIEIHFDLNREVFHDAMIERVPHHFMKVLDAFLDDIDQPILKPTIVTGSESNDLLKTPKGKNEDYISIIDHFESQVRKTPKGVALQFNNTTYTYGELNTKSNRLAKYLQAKEIGPGSKVALYLNRGIDYIIGLLAILKTNGTFIPIASDQPFERIKYILKDAECTLVLTHSELVLNLDLGQIHVLEMDKSYGEQITLSSSNLGHNIDKKGIAYILYTSGSTGHPKGVLISQGALTNYLTWATDFYKTEELFVFPLFTSVGFDLTITSTFLPLINGGKLIIYEESKNGPDFSLTKILEDDLVNSIKLTPSHLALIQNSNYALSRISTMIVGGEDLKTSLARSIQQSFGPDLRIFNEYGPTEATVGCLVSQFDAKVHRNTSVPIGLPIANTQAYILDDHLNLVPKGVVGTLYIGGPGLADGYLNLSALTSEKFIDSPFHNDYKIYHTGDLARINNNGDFEYLGRIDDQVKLRGHRIELRDIEANLTGHHGVDNCAVILLEQKKSIPEAEIQNCIACGLPSNYPSADLDARGVCHLCNAFKNYKDKAMQYFKSEDELRQLLISQRGKSLHYDCISLLSGGKDSTYVLAQLVGMGLKVLAYTLDNGYISNQAKNNIDRIVNKLKVDHLYGQTKLMNKIFVDSLKRHQNVCNGCFKTIYTLSTKIALEKEIPFIVTGLSRGQFFETRLTEELFLDKTTNVDTIDNTILEARKLYHREEDAVKTLMDVSVFNDDNTFDKVQFVDFYRYSDVSLEVMLKYLEEKVGWLRPTDTGRSTNCLINQVGIYVHTKQKGYSNYSFPYSWDVRMGHKTRTETMEEINELIDEKEVKRIMDEIGYDASMNEGLDQERLVGFYAGAKKIGSQELKDHLKKLLPDFMIPTHFKFMKALPLTNNGKVDKAALKVLNTSQLEMETPFVAPEGELEELVANIWKEVLRLKKVGVHDNFIALGGHSLAAIRVTARINEELEIKFPLNKIFEQPTIAEYANYVEKTLVALMNE